jgi:hypothetical protein
MRVSIDFDKTLSKKHVQKYIKDLIQKGIDVWVTTARYDDVNIKIYAPQHNNIRLWEVINDLGIPKEKVYFTNMELKSDYINGKDFIFHLDDDSIELEFLEKTNIVGVNVLDENYQVVCNKLIEYATKNLIQNKKNFFTGVEPIWGFPTHPFTCDRHSINCEIHDNKEGILIENGEYLICPCGDYKQKLI